MSEKLTKHEREQIGTGIIGFFLQGMDESLTEQHLLMLTAVCELFANGDKVTIPSLATQLKYNNNLDKVGGLEVIVKLNQDFLDAMDDMKDEE